MVEMIGGQRRTRGRCGSGIDTNLERMNFSVMRRWCESEAVFVAIRTAYDKDTHPIRVTATVISPLSEAVDTGEGLIFYPGGIPGADQTE